MSTAHYIVGDVREVLSTLPDGCVDLVLTSPPFLALRSYLSADHPDKAKEIGSEANPADFLDTLLDLTVEWRRVLAPHGSLVVELGDTYAGSGGAGGDYAEGGMRDGQPTFKANTRRDPTRYQGTGGRSSDDPSGFLVRNGGGRGWPLDKSLCGIPELYRLSLAYGRNMLRPDRTIEPWRVRNVIRWCRPNPPVGALGDKFRPATSDMVVACTSRTRWFDLDAVRTAYDGPPPVGGSAPMQPTDGTPSSRQGVQRSRIGPVSNPGGAPPLDWWQVSTEPFSGAHYATWPRALLTRPIQAMCPPKVCTTCGEPSRRIVDNPNTGHGSNAWNRHGTNSGEAVPHKWEDRPIVRETTTLGWTDCGHDAYRPGCVLDPFAGSGTTGAVATGHGRDAILVDLDARNLELARERIGMWLVEGSPFETGDAA